MRLHAPSTILVLAAALLGCEAERAPEPSPEAAMTSRALWRAQQPPKALTPHQAVVALPNGRVMVAHDIGDDGERAVVVTLIDGNGAIGERSTLPAAARADHPQLAALRDGTVVAAWTADAGKGNRIHLARVRFGR